MREPIALLRLVRVVMLTAIAAMSPQAAAAATVTADVVALDHVIVYNRFGSINPYGMIYALRRDVVTRDGVPIGAGGEPCQVRLRDDKRPRPLVLRVNAGDRLQVTFTNLLCGARPGSDAPATRSASMVVAGLTNVGATSNAVATGIAGVPPGASTVYEWKAEREGTHLIFSNAAPAGGEGDGGGLAHGLFGAVNVEPAGSVWYRSQVTADELAAATTGHDTGTGLPLMNYDAVDASGTPILRMRNGNEIVHSDLNAIIANVSRPAPLPWMPKGSFREFTAIMHDELKTVHTFPALEEEEQLHGIRDGFAFNYGASGLGSSLLSNRLGIGPAKDCVTCLYEEFFLTSWANGDPALLAQYADDPSNVHHSYLNDEVVFRNTMAGPKETHVFHLHGHQWLAQQYAENATYLDSQTIGPLQGFSYPIAWGGSGNRNRTAGDAIFHCHLYPHFAQGMWALWRIHDTFEDGSRRLPDGELGPGTDPVTGATTGGTPIPAVVPIPGNPMAPQPTYGVAGTPGYPFYIAGTAGQRPPQAPLDIAHDGGLPRHVATGGTRVTNQALGAAADFSVQLLALNLRLLPQQGTALEQAAMAFHAKADGHPTITPEGSPATLAVNGRPAKPGAPFADPCPSDAPVREYRVSAVQLDLVVNKAGWHDPQARINVLDSDAGTYEGRTTSADPFFFRANSDDCIVYYHTNRTPKELQRDDFQVRTPTDIIGQHIHLVKFDVTSSDGSANGWNYLDGTLARDAIEEMIAATRAPGGSAVDAAHNPVELTPSGHQTTVQRWWADPLLNTAGQDRTIRTVFTHDHFAPSSIQHHGFYSALLVEPAGSAWLAPDGAPLANGVGPEAMIVGASDASMHPDHREFVLAVADFAIVYDRGRPVNAPALPEAISAADPGTYLVNYKNEPLPLRLSRTGNLPLNPGGRGDMAYAFSSSAHGRDPFTPVFRTYQGDRIQLRIVQGAQEEQHAFTAHGLRWRRDVSSPASTFVNTQEIGLSEHFNLDVPALIGSSRTAQTADYLWSFASTDDLWNGAWGLIRAYANQNVLDPVTRSTVKLARLPGTAPGSYDYSALNADGCPRGAPVKRFYVEAWAARDLLPENAIVYNAREEVSDPSGLLFILAEHAAAYRAGSTAVEPLVLRANAGDCVKVTLTNKLPTAVPDHAGDAPLPPITGLSVDDVRPSNRVSLHPQLLSYDVRTSDGANAGLNPDQTVAPGKSRTYTWYAGALSVVDRKVAATPVEFGASGLTSFADVIKHSAQGLVGALIVEPAGSTYKHPETGAPLKTGTVARVCSGASCFKEFVVVYQDGLNLVHKGGLLGDNFIADDPEDAGAKAVNYRTEPFCLRLGLGGSCDTNDSVYPADFFLDSYAQVETPVFQASAYEPVRFRVVLPHGRGRQRSFGIYGHDYADLGMTNFGSSGWSLLASGKAITAEPYGGAQPGVWLYRDGPSFMFSSGVWGRFEVK